MPYTQNATMTSSRCSASTTAFATKLWSHYFKDELFSCCSFLNNLGSSAATNVGTSHYKDTNVRNYPRSLSSIISRFLVFWKNVILTSSSSSSIASPVKYNTDRGTIRSRKKWPISKSAARIASESSSCIKQYYFLNYKMVTALHIHTSYMDFDVARFTQITDFFVPGPALQNWNWGAKFDTFSSPPTLYSQELLLQ